MIFLLLFGNTSCGGDGVQVGGEVETAFNPTVYEVLVWPVVDQVVYDQESCLVAQGDGYDMSSCCAPGYVPLGMSTGTTVVCAEAAP